MKNGRTRRGSDFTSENNGTEKSRSLLHLRFNEFNFPCISVVDC